MIPPLPPIRLTKCLGNFRSFKALIAAEYNGMDITVEDFDAAAAALSPLGKAPVLKTAGGVIFEVSNGIWKRFGITL